jgi:hypothetical protein
VLRHPLVVGAALAYGSGQLARRWLHWPLPGLLGAYLGDLLCLPLMLSAALALHRALICRTGTLPGAWVLAAWLAVSVWFEGLLPLWSARATADPLDVVAYALGGLAFQRWLNKPVSGSAPR